MPQLTFDACLRPRRVGTIAWETLPGALHLRQGAPLGIIHARTRILQWTFSITALSRRPCRTMASAPPAPARPSRRAAPRNAPRGSLRARPPKGPRCRRATPIASVSDELFEWLQVRHRALRRARSIATPPTHTHRLRTLCDTNKAKQKREARAASRPASESQPCKTQLEALRLSRRAPRPALSLSRGMKVAEQCQARDSTSY